MSDHTPNQHSEPTVRLARRPRAPLAAGLGVMSLILLAGCSGDDDDADVAAPVTISDSLADEAQEVLDEAEEALEQAQDEAQEALDEGSVPSLDEIEDDVQEALDDGSVPSLDEVGDDVQETLGEIADCFGIDLSELTDFEALEDELDQLDEIDLGTVPSSLPFDESFFEDLGDLGAMSPEEIEQLLNEQLDDLRGALSSVPDVSIPDISVPEFSVPSIPEEATEIGECLSALNGDS